MPLPYKPELPYKPTNTGDVPAKHTATTLPQIYDRESQVTVAQRNRNRGWPACPTWLIEGEARECHGDHGRCTHMGVCACDRGFAGDACEVRTCPLKCSGHGVCVPGGDTPDCACDAGYGGRSCNEKLKHHHHAAPPEIPVFSIHVSRILKFPIKNLKSPAPPAVNSWAAATYSHF